MRKIFRVYGESFYDGTGRWHRQKESFEPSRTWNFTRADGEDHRPCNVKIEIRNSDITGTNDFTELCIEAETAYAAYSELCGQLSDGLFENTGTGKITEIVDGVEAIINPYNEANNARA